MTDTTNMVPLELLDGTVEYIRADGHSPLRVFAIRPSQKTLYTLHSGAHSSRYTGADLRQLNAERGVGRPPRKPSKRKI
jgi:hypothetical protein